MKKIMYLSALSLLFLSGCKQLDQAIKGDSYVASSQAKEEAKKELKKLNQADMPQLQSKVAEDEAEVKLKTSQGDITIKLFPKYAPLAVENFLTHAKEGYYDGLTFHRVIKDFMIQSGDPNGDGTGGESIWNGKDSAIDAGYGFKNEISPYLYHIRGALAMANTGDSQSNGSQFFIIQNSDNQSSQTSSDSYPQKIIEAYKNGGYPSLDGNYTVFGQVIDGMDIVDKIAHVETNSNDKPKKDITIDSIQILKDYSFK